MVHTICYTGQIELVPEIEDALAAHGYTIAIPPCPSATGTTTVLTCGAAAIVLAEAPRTATVEIEVSGVAGVLAAELLESLPIALHKQCEDPMAQ